MLSLKNLVSKVNAKILTGAGLLAAAVPSAFADQLQHKAASTNAQQAWEQVYNIIQPIIEGNIAYAIALGLGLFGGYQIGIRENWKGGASSLVGAGVFAFAPKIIQAFNAVIM